MRTTTIVFALVLSMSGVARAQDWTEYVNTQEGFKVDLPGQPKVTETTRPHRVSSNATRTTHGTRIFIS